MRSSRCARIGPWRTIPVAVVSGLLGLGLSPAPGQGEAAAESGAEADAGGAAAGRRPADQAAALRWLDNAIGYHGFSVGEAAAALAMSEDEVAEALRNHPLEPGSLEKLRPEGEVLVLPYPGGRHPRAGFLDGAVDPQRETKLGVFPPWLGGGYAVADIPEAVWSNLGLTYLAHTHIATVWTGKGIELEQLEWEDLGGGRLRSERTLPNKITFGVEVKPAGREVRFEMWLHNGTGEALNDLRVQQCIMLKALDGFGAQTGENKLLEAPYAACRSESGDRWVVTGWSPCHRAWENPPVPCIHSDPVFPDCPPGERVTVHGVLSFYEGDDVAAEFARLEASGWDAGGDAGE